MKDCDIPRWVNQEVSCLWCKKFMDIEYIEIKEEDIHVIFFCENEKCDHLKRKERPAEFTLIYEGYLEQYEDFLTRPQEVDKMENELMGGLQESKL